MGGVHEGEGEETGAHGGALGRRRHSQEEKKEVFLSGTRELYNRTEGNLVNESARIECSTGVCLEM